MGNRFTKLQLPLFLLEAIFSFSGGYNYLHRQVCSEFRRMLPEVDHLAYIDALLGDKRAPKGLKDSHKLLELSVDKGYLNILLFHGNYVLPWEFCIRCARNGHLHMLQWAKDKGYVITQQVYREAVKADQGHVVQWLIDNNLS
ncbi:Hypothetical protein ZAZAV_372 [Cedratvirus Zaza IHUMI]|uniref:Ankyrin repeat-containing protein n=1 Tax=Cedratvirus Zaza IHUMI TaxID=2126979 RepID=A0A2R8FF01_9VIRU|nr:Hypothetical protein ZAZAV_372 [Cedratvirus Zaza IHUMI]